MRKPTRFDTSSTPRCVVAVNGQTKDLPCREPQSRERVRAKCAPSTTYTNRKRRRCIRCSFQIFVRERTKSVEHVQQRVVMRLQDFSIMRE
eukprot:scaffold284638_cov32-Tisochrysis_lutea.AAC.1